MNLPVIVVGAGGHARVVADALKSRGREVLGFLDIAAGLHGSRIDGMTVLGNDHVLQRYPTASVVLANGIGSVTTPTARQGLYQRLRALGYVFETVCHVSAIVAKSVDLAPGAQIMAGAVLQPAVVIGEDTIINTGAIVDHDCTIGAHCHVAPGVVLSGAVTIGDGTHIGTGASVIQGVTIGVGALIAAGAVVVDDVPDRTRVAGIPARLIGPA